MATILVNLSNGEEEIPLEIFPGEDFGSVLRRANELMGYEIDIKSFTDGEEASLSENAYDYLTRKEPVYALQNDEQNADYFDEEQDTQNTEPREGSLIINDEDLDDDAIKIIQVSENDDIKSEEILNSLNNFTLSSLLSNKNISVDEIIDETKFIEPKLRNRVTCHYCLSRLIAMKDQRRNYILEEKNTNIFRKVLDDDDDYYVSAKLICGKCLNARYQRIRTFADNLEEDEFMVISESIKLFYKALPESLIKKRSRNKAAISRLLNKAKKEKSKLMKDFAWSSKAAELKNKQLIKRKLEMDGTISETIFEMEKKQKLRHNNDLICWCCGLVFDSLSEVLEHCHVHQVNNRVNGIPCVLCLRYFRTSTTLKIHIYSEHQEVKQSIVTDDDGYLDESSGSYIKREGTSKVSVEIKKEEGADEYEPVEDYLADRLHKYLSGELDPDIFFQQETTITNSNKQILADFINIEDEDDDDGILCIVVEESNNEKNSASDDMQRDTNDQNDEVINDEETGEQAVLEEQEEIRGEEVELFEENMETIMNDSGENNEIEAFQEVEYYEDPEYEPDDDADSVISIDEKKIRKKSSGQGKYKCEMCNKAYTSQVRYEQHKCYSGMNNSGSNKDKDNLTCSICNETFLSKVRLQFHRQTHREGGWQQMGCDRCSRKDFASEHELFDHIYFSHSKPFHCQYEGCNKTFKLRKLLKTHMRDHGTKKFGCHICGLRFQIHQTLKEHMVLHMKVKPYQCHICHKFMNKVSRLRMHLLVHTSEQKPTHVLVCRLCDAAFKNPQEAEAHCDNPHECEPKEDDKDGFFNEIAFVDMETLNIDEMRTKSFRPENSGELEAEEDGKYIGNTLVNKQNLLLQLSDIARNTIIAVWIDKVYSCQYCEKVYYTKEALHQHRRIHNGTSEPYQCHLCEAKFLTYSRCTAHKSTHGYFKEGGAPSLRDFPVIKHYLCDICDKSNLLWTTVSVHYRHHHKYNSNRRHPPPCKTCSQQFSYSWDLGKHRRIKHRREVHEGAKAPNKVVNFSYKCTECDQELPTKSSLTTHRKMVHPDCQNKSTSKPGLLVCSECGKTYSTKPALLTHIKWHTEHGIGKEAARRRKRAFGKGSYICSTCGLGFYSGANLRAHIERIHEKSYKFTCEECGKGHFTHMEMETHKLTHTGERPFKCPDCPRAYVTRAILNKHYRNHTGERPYSCDLCNATFKTAHSRNYHKMKHDSGKIPSPYVVLEVKGGSSKRLQAALQVMANKDNREIREKSYKHVSEVKNYIKEELEEFHQEVNAEEVLVRTTEVEEFDDNIVSVQQETPEGVQIIYKKIIKTVDENGCEDEFTIEYEDT